MEASTLVPVTLYYASLLGLQTPLGAATLLFSRTSWRDAVLYPAVGESPGAEEEGCEVAPPFVVSTPQDEMVQA